jgi:hypothetical protein
MTRRLLTVVGLVLLFCGTLIAEKVSTTIQCGKPDKESTAEAGDASGHMLALTETTCPYSAGSLAGVKVSKGRAAEFDDVRGNHMSFRGYWTETYGNGDIIFYRYHGMAKLKDGAVESAKDSWTVLRGTGKMKGATGKGTCTGTGGAGGHVTWTCTGDISLPK